MRDPAERTLTAVQSPLSPGEQRDRAVLLVVGSADAPALPARTRLQIAGDDLFVGRRAEGVPQGANVAVLDDGLVSSQHARITRGAGGYDLEDLGSKNGTWVDNQRIEAKVRLRDGALLFFGNHVAVFRMVSQIELEAIKAELVAPFGPVATASPALAVACDRLRRLAASEGELLILGETGAGKEVYARAVHQASGRQEGRFVAINCAAIPRELVESELFGYRQGAHSTAHQAKAGLIEEAEGGTLFLDEIGEMTPEAQIKILRFLQDRELTPLGSTRPRQMDVRIVAATNRTAAGPGKGPSGLRDDIVGRLGAAPIYLPPLRNRVEDLGVLTAHFLGAGLFLRQVRAAGLPRARAARMAAQRPRAGEDHLHRGGADRGRQADRAARSARADRARAVGPGRRRRAPHHRTFADAGADRGVAAPLRGERGRRLARARQAPRRRLALDQEVRPRPAEVPAQRVARGAGRADTQRIEDRRSPGRLGSIARIAGPVRRPPGRPVGPAAEHGRIRHHVCGVANSARSSP